MADMEYLKAKYPTMHHAPRENCKFCKGTGEREVKKLSKPGQPFITRCICIFVDHGFCDEAAGALAKVAKEALEEMHG